MHGKLAGGGAEGVGPERGDERSDEVLAAPLVVEHPQREGERLLQHLLSLERIDEKRDDRRARARVLGELGEEFRRAPDRGAVLEEGSERCHRHLRRLLLHLRVAQRLRRDV